MTLRSQSLKRPSRRPPRSSCSHPGSGLFVALIAAGWIVVTAPPGAASNQFLDAKEPSRLGSAAPAQRAAVFARKVIPLDSGPI